MCLAFSVCGPCMWLSRNSREASWDLAVSSRDQPKTVQGRLPPRHSTRDAHTDARPSDPSQRQGLHQTTNQQNISSRTPRPRPDITHADDRNRCHHVVALNACKSREATASTASGAINSHGDTWRTSLRCSDLLNIGEVHVYFRARSRACFRARGHTLQDLEFLYLNRRYACFRARGGARLKA